MAGRVCESLSADRTQRRTALLALFRERDFTPCFGDDAFLFGSCLGHISFTEVKQSESSGGCSLRPDFLPAISQESPQRGQTCNPVDSQLPPRAQPGGPLRR